MKMGRKSTCLVTEGAGFIGSHLIEWLAVRGEAEDDLKLPPDAFTHELTF